MGSIQNAIGLWLCRYVFIYPLPMPSVLRAPRTPRVPQRPGSSFFKLSRSCLPRRRRCQDLLLFNLQPPSHTELQHQPHTHANLPPPSQVTRYALSQPPPHITDSSARVLQTLSACFGRSRNTAHAPSSNLLNPLATCHALHQTINLTDTVQ